MSEDNRIPLHTVIHIEGERMTTGQGRIVRGFVNLEGICVGAMAGAVNWRQLGQIRPNPVFPLVAIASGKYTFRVIA